MFLGLDLCYTDPVQHAIPCRQVPDLDYLGRQAISCRQVQDLDYLDRELPDVCNLECSFHIDRPTCGLA